MSAHFAELRPVYVAGVGLHAYQAASGTSYVELGLAAVRAALADAGLPWSEVEASFVGTATLGIAGGRAMLKHLGPSGAPILHVENASASGSAAFRQACVEVASGLADVALAVGVDKPANVTHAYKHTGEPTLVGEAVALPTHFALVASEYVAAHGLKPADVAAAGGEEPRQRGEEPLRPAAQGAHPGRGVGEPYRLGPPDRPAVLPGGGRAPRRPW